ncbi:hypothetical protein ACFVHW_11510 [Streptomyces sp. NPDC127110]|uniref:Mu transposase domain-containing protein n=1 Tax=Streptomyces sp. NPDC127110 TaxID=3345362 RepID=UPI0036369E02
MRIRTIGQDFATEQPLPAALPEDPFETGRLSAPLVDRYSQICVRMNRYSVPVRLIGRTVRHAPHLRAGGLRRPRRSRPPRTAHRPRRHPPRTRPPSGGPGPETECTAWCHRPRPGPCSCPVYSDP